MERRRKRRPGMAARWADRVRRTARRCGGIMRNAWRAADRHLRPWKPTVLVDARRGRARRLRRMLTRATRTQFRALGVAPPEHLLVVVQRAVQQEQPLASLLQVFEHGDGTRRHVLFLALSVGEESMSDGAVVAVLRQQLHEVVGEALGPLVCTVRCGARPERRPAVVVPFRHQDEVVASLEEAPPPDDRWAPVDDGVYAVGAER